MTVEAQAAIREALQRYLDVDVAADVWDEEPNLVLIIQDADGVSIFVPVPVGEAAWAAAEPYRVVIAAADTARFLHSVQDWSALAPGEELLGVALFTEGWGVTQDDPAAVEQIDAWLKAGHRLVEHPLAVEVKLVTAVFAEGAPIMLMHARGGAKLPDVAETDVGGRVPDALTYLLTTFLELAAVETD